MHRKQIGIWKVDSSEMAAAEVTSFDKSPFTMRYMDANTELEYVRYLYDASLTLNTCIVTSLLVAVLFIAEAISESQTHIEVFLLSVGCIVSVTAFASLCIGRWCFQMYRCSMAPLSEAQKVSYIMECIAATAAMMSLCIAGYLSYYPLSSYQLLHRAFEHTVYDSTSINSLFVGIKILLAAGNRPRCIFIIPAYMLSLIAAYCGSMWSGAHDAWMHSSKDPDDFRWQVLMKTQFGVSTSLVVLCILFRVVREWQHRRHFQQRHSMWVNRTRVAVNERELQKIIERFVPALGADPSSREGLVIHSNPKGVCGFVEILHKDYMLPNSSRSVHTMAKIIARVEQAIRRYAEGGAIERVILDGDSFCCTSGLERVSDELGTRTIDALKCLHAAIAEASRWNIPDLLRGMQGKGSVVDDGVLEESPPLELRAVLHTGPLLGSAIGRSTFQYSITGECVLVSQWMLASHPSNRHILLSRAALEACGEHVRVVPQHPMEILLHGRRELLSTFLVVRIDEEDNLDEPPDGKGPILDLLVTPPYDASTVDDSKKESFSLLAELAGERSVFSGAHGSADLPSEDARQVERLAGLDSIAAYVGKESKGFFSDAVDRDAAVSRQLGIDISRSEIRSRGLVGERFIFAEQETRFFRVRSAWQTPLRTVVILVLIALISVRHQWASIISHLCATEDAAATQLCVQAEIEDSDEEHSSVSRQLFITEIVVWGVLLLIFLMGNVLRSQHSSKRRSILFYARSIESLLLDVLVLLLAGHYYLKKSTLSRQWPSLMWILMLCHYFSYIPLRASHLFGAMLVALSIVFYTLTVQLWRPVDIVHIVVVIGFFGMMATAEERQDRRFFRDALIARAAAVAQRKKQFILGGVLRATIPSILHTFHRSLLQMRPTGSSIKSPSTNSGTLVVMHEHLVVAQLLWRGGGCNKILFDRVSLVERCVQEGNELIDVLLRRNKRPTGRGDGALSESDSDNEMPGDGGATSVGEQHAQRPSICVTCCLGDVVTIAGLPVSSPHGQVGAVQQPRVDHQVAAIVASTIYVFERCVALHQEPSLSLSGAISLGLGASLMSYEDDPKYSMGGLPLTQVSSVIRTVGTTTTGAYVGLWATTDAVSALGEMFPDDVIYLQAPDGGNEFSVRVGVSKRWRTRGVGAVDVHPISLM